MKSQRKIFQRAGIAMLMSFSINVAIAGSIATEQMDSGGLTLSPTVTYDLATLRVSSDNSDTTGTYDSGDNIRVDTGSMADGVYYYELLLSNKPSEKEPNGAGVSQNGSFKVENGIGDSNSD